MAKQKNDDAPAPVTRLTAWPKPLTRDVEPEPPVAVVEPADLEELEERLKQQPDVTTGDEKPKRRAKK